MKAGCLQPMAGAHGELTGVLLIAAFHRDRGDTARDTILIPDSAHGTNPASAAIAGFKVKEIPSNDTGTIDFEAFAALLGPHVAGVMLTCPNTHGFFEPRVADIAARAHEAGALMYYDGANLNAIIGRCRPGDLGFDVMHFNLHKTFGTPHGMGGPVSTPSPSMTVLSLIYPPRAWLRRKKDFPCKMPNGPWARCPRFSAASLLPCALMRISSHWAARASKPPAAWPCSTPTTCSAGCATPIPPPMTAGVCTNACLQRPGSPPERRARLDIAKALLDRGFHAPPSISRSPSWKTS